jgi:hypothetical protein
LPKKTSASRSLLAEKESTNVCAACCTYGQRQPIELETSMMSDRSTMRRVASPVARTVRFWKFASFMNVVGTTAVADTLTTFTPVLDRVLIV